MKKIFLAMLLLTITFFANAQLKTVIDRSKQRAKDRSNQKIDNTIESVIDSAFNKTGRGAKDVVKGKSSDKKSNPDSSGEKNSSKNVNEGQQQGDTETKNTNDQTPFVAYRKFDFVPGEKIMVIEDFSQDAVGDFPDKWNTNSSGEIVTIEGKEGKWLMVQNKGLLIPEFINLLPENFTFEFDLICNRDFDFYSTAFFFDIASLKSQADYMIWKQHSYENRNGAEFRFHPMYATKKSGFSEYKVYENGKEISKNLIVTGQFHSQTNNHVKVSVWRQKQRVRIYLNEEKVWDIPKALNATMKYNSIIFALVNSRNTTDRYYIGNLKLAVGAPDTRNKLITEGKFITRGILFDVNSDKIKPESYGTLKDIANVLLENTEVKVKIIGHTDADGEVQANLDLSKRRALAVKSALIKEFNIEETRLQTDGKGENEPADKSATPEGKANNRRVEFVKI